MSQAKDTGPAGLPTLQMYLRGLGSFYILDILRLLTHIILTPYILHYLGEERFGVQVTVSALMGYLGLLDFGLSSVLSKYVAEERARGGNETISRIVSSALWTFVVTGAVGGLFAALLSLKMGWLFRDLALLHLPEARTFLLVMGLNFALSLPLGLLAGVPFAYERVDLMNLVRVVQLLAFPAVAAATIVFDWGLAGLAAGNILASLLGGVGNLYFAYRLHPGLSLAPANARLAEVKRMFSYGFLFFINGISVALVFQTDALVISSGIGAAAVSLYSVIAGGSQQVMQFVFKIGDTLYPTYARLQAADKMNSLARAFLSALRYTILVACPLGVFFAVFGHDLFTVWLRPDSAIPLGVVYVFGVMIFAHTLAHVSGMFVAATGALARIVWWSIAEGVLNLALSLLLLPHLGVEGVALATIIAQLATTVWLYPRVARQMIPQVATSRFMGEILRPLLFGCLTLVAMVALERVCAGAGLQALARMLLGLAGAALFLGLGVWLGRRQEELP